MTPNAIAYYAVAVLIVLPAGAAVGSSLRRAGYAGAAVIVLMAVLEVISGAYASRLYSSSSRGSAAAVRSRSCFDAMA